MYIGLHPKRVYGLSSWVHGWAEGGYVALACQLRALNAVISDTWRYANGPIAQRLLLLTLGIAETYGTNCFHRTLKTSLHSLTPDARHCYSQGGKYLVEV